MPTLSSIAGLRKVMTWRSRQSGVGRTDRRVNRAFFAEFEALIRRGIEAVEFRPVDEGVAAHSIVGSTRSLSWWFDPAGPRSAEFVADQIADTALRGLLSSQPHELPP